MSHPPFDWADVDLLRRLLVELRVAFDDADAVACDLLRKRRRRALGHVQHKKLYRDARRKLLQILEQLLIPPSPPPPPAEGTHLQ